VVLAQCPLVWALRDKLQAPKGQRRVGQKAGNPVARFKAQVPNNFQHIDIPSDSP